MGGERSRRRRFSAVLFHPLLLLTLPSRILPVALAGLLGLILLPRLFCFPFRLYARNLLLTHRFFFWSGGGGGRIDELSGEPGVGEVRIARVYKVDRVCSGEADGRWLGADVARARRRGGLFLFYFNFFFRVSNDTRACVRACVCVCVCEKRRFFFFDTGIVICVCMRERERKLTRL